MENLESTCRPGNLLPMSFRKPLLMKNLTHSKLNNKVQWPAVLLLVGALFPMQAISGPQDRVSSEGTYEMAEVSETEAKRGSKKKRSRSFSGTADVTHHELSLEGVDIYDGSGGKFTDEEYSRLSGLPDPGATGSGDGTEVIIGRDTRQRLYTTNYPARAEVLITFSGGRCSGTLIGPNTVSTAGHCVHTGGSSGSWRSTSSFRIYAGANGSSKPYGSCRARSLHSVTGWTRNRNERYDYGAIKLNCTVGNRVGWFGFTTAYPKNLPSIVQGYPGDKPLTQWLSADKVWQASSRQVFYRNDTTGGMSGSAVWYDRNGPYIIGIHAYGKHGSGNHRNYNHGVRIVRDVFNNLRSWKNL